MQSQQIEGWDFYEGYPSGEHTRKRDHAVFFFYLLLLLLLFFLAFQRFGASKFETTAATKEQYQTVVFLILN
jgi:hypothetical protein